MYYHQKQLAIGLLLAIAGSGCRSDLMDQLHHQSVSIQRGGYLLSTTNDTPGSFYQMGVYVVGKGDTLAIIATKFNTQIADIMAINPKLEPNRLVIGQRIRIFENKQE